MVDRRAFLHNIAAAGATSATVTSNATAADTRTARFHVKGFTCITCAVGLQVVLREQKGIAQARATYSDGIVFVRFDPALTSESVIKEFINTTTGFTVAEATASR